MAVRRSIGVAMGVLVIGKVMIVVVVGAAVVMKVVVVGVTITIIPKNLRAMVRVVKG